MVAEASLIVAALLSTAPHAPYSRMPVCDEAGVYALDDEADAEAALHDTPAVANCSEAPPLVLSCNDDPAGRWTQDMIGSCDMPRTVAAPSLQRPSRDPASMCRGSGCEHDPNPLRAAGRGDDTRSSLAVSKEAPVPRLASGRLAEGATSRPRSAPRARLDRPPRA